MKKTRLLAFSTITFSACLLSGAGICAYSYASAEETTAPTCSIVAETLQLKENVYILYAVDFQDTESTDKTGLLVWNAPQTSYVYGTADTVLTSSQKVDIDNETFDAFKYTKLAAKQMTDVVYASAYVQRDGVYYYSDVKKYSVLEYAYNKLGKTDATPTTDENLKSLLNAMLSYGAAAQTYLDYKTDTLATDDFTYVSVKNAHFEDGFNDGLFKTGTSVTVTPDDDYKLTDSVSYLTKNEDGTFTLTVPEEKIVDTTSATFKYSQGLTFTANDDGTYALTDIGECTDTDIVIQPTYNGKPVTAIAESAFWANTTLTSIVIPDSVTSIGYFAFYDCPALTKITFNGTKAQWNAITIEVDALSSDVTISCTDGDITNGTIGGDTGDNGGNTENGGNTDNGGDTGDNENASQGLKFELSENEAYYYVSIGTCTDTDIIIPSTYNGLPVAEIKDWAFKDCTSLRSVTIPDSVVHIGMSAFYDCTNLAEIVLSKNLATIASYAFYHTAITSITIPEGVMRISLCSFEGTALTSVTISDGVTSIGVSAFEKCTALTSVTIGKGVTTIETQAFYGCTSLTEITFNGTKAEWGAITIKDDAIPDGVTITCTDGNVGEDTGNGGDVDEDENASQGLEFDENYDGTYSVSGIGTCTDTDIIIPSKYEDKPVTEIKNDAFRDCKALTSVVIPDSVTSIGSSAFRECSVLTSVVIPDSVTSIGDQAFENCAALASVTIGKGVTTIGGSAFVCCSSLTSIAIPDNVTTIGCAAFWQCTALTSVELPAGITSIDGDLFYMCTALTSVTIPKTVTSIGACAFEICTALKTITFKGTKAEWEKITLGEDWHGQVPEDCKIVCTDGEISLS